MKNYFNLIVNLLVLLISFFADRAIQLGKRLQLGKSAISV